VKKTTSKNHSWGIKDSLDYYNIENWSAGYFDINNNGNLCIWPYGKPGPSIDMMDVIEEIKRKKLSLPCIVRFQDVLRSRVQTLIKTFEKHIKESNYSGKYFGVYPIKVNQMREVVEEILDAGSKWNFGMEAGSKAELTAVLAYNTNPKALTICNGYKDEDYLKLALLGRKLDRKVIVVIEKLSELPHLIKTAKKMKVEPYIGIRARLSTRGAGKWISSSGDFAKFGLTAPEIIEATKILKKNKMESSLKLFHFHCGSQLTDIRTIKDALNEAARIYAKLQKMKFDIEYFDVGGGLGVDYDGSQSTADSSINYTLEEYVADVVYSVQSICKSEGVKEPHLVSESGRALTAHHSCIVMNVFGSIQLGEELTPIKVKKSSPEIVKQMIEIKDHFNGENFQETYHDATEKKEQALSMFKLGILSLEDRALIEQLYWKLCQDIIESQKKVNKVSEETISLDKDLSDQYLANFSLFQSAPDHWAFDQLFPIVPLHRHQEKPVRRGKIVDITCDSDGKIDQFISKDKPKPVLSFHELNKNKPYYIGLFLLGAYQDIMGDMHNLFGRLNEVHIFCDDEDPEDFYIEETIRGDMISDVIQRLQYFPNDLVKSVKKKIDQQVRKGRIKPREGVNLTDFFEDVIKSYTYLNN
jgi:arginine decarboxylase